jgi:hypothetical protein
MKVEPGVPSQGKLKPQLRESYSRHAAGKSLDPAGGMRAEEIPVTPVTGGQRVDQSVDHETVHRSSFSGELRVESGELRVKSEEWRWGTVYDSMGEGEIPVQLKRAGPQRVRQEVRMGKTYSVKRAVE